jgi:endonuclease/exonuclease/phosphatase (EEP) superfamily protein YafD
VAVGLTGLALVLLVLPGRRRSWPVTAVLLVGAVVSAGVLGARGTTGLLDLAPPVAANEEALVVLVLNTQGGVRPLDLAELVTERRADVVALPETRLRDAERAAEHAADRGRAFRVLADDGIHGSATGATALLVAEGLGEYEVTAHQGGTFAGFTATGKGPPLTAVHPFPPLPGATATWRDEGAAAVTTCESVPGAVVAGDLNTTPDHPAGDLLDRCVLATVAGGSGGVGTWPASVPRALGAPIDQVLVDAETWRVERARVLEPPAGTDHRVVEVVLRAR